MYLVRLSCEHWLELKTMSSVNCPEEWCRKCGAMRSVIDYSREQWHTRCQDCSYSRSHGLVRKYAEQAAARHMARYRTHRVAVLFYNAVSRTVLAESAVDESYWGATLFDTDEEGPPPF